MIAHQYIGMQPEASSIQRIPQPRETRKSVLVIEEAGPTVVPSLHDVQRDSVQLNSRSPRHTGILTENDPDPFLP